MPVAVAQLNVAGVPIAGLSLIVPALNVATVTPTLFLSSLRGVTVLDGWVGDDSGSAGMGGYVQALHARGLRGPALADAIQDELRDRGVPGGPKRTNTPGFDVLNPAFFSVVVGRHVDPDVPIGVGRGRAGGRGDQGGPSGRGDPPAGPSRGGRTSPRGGRP